MLTAIFGSIVLFAFANSYEPQIDSQLDFFDISLPIAQFVTGIFGLFVARKYGWTSQIFGRAYLAMSIGFLVWGVGSSVFLAIAVFDYTIPYPGWPDIFFVITYSALLFHLSSITRYFKRKFKKKDFVVIIAIPVTINLIYVAAVLLQPSIPGSVPDLLSKEVTIGGNTYQLSPVTKSNSSQYQQITVDNATYELIPTTSNTGYPQVPQTNSTFDPIPIAFERLTFNFDPSKLTPDFWPPFFAGLFYNSITTVNLSFAILGMTVFRGSMLGTAWGILLVGFILTSSADIVYDFTSIYGDIRTSLAIPLWVFGCMILSYALFLHRKHV